MPQLFDAHGRPYPARRGTDTARDSAWEALTKLGVEIDSSGDMKVPHDVLQRLRAERARRIAVTSVPRTERFLHRDAGGVGVAKNQDRVNMITMEGLRRIARRAPIIKVIHQARQYQIRHLCRKWSGKKGEVGYRVGHKRQHESGIDVPEGFAPYIKRFEAMLESPAPSYDCNTTSTLIQQLWNDLATINRPACEVIHSLLDKDRVVQFAPVDGNTIWPTLLWLEKWKADNPTWAGGHNPEELTEEDQLELASVALEWDFTGAKYCVVRDGLLEGVLAPGEVLVAPIMNSTDITLAGYPPSHVELAMELITAFIRTFDYNASYFTRGMMAEFLLAIPDMHPEDVDAFLDMFREATQGVEKAWQPPVLPYPGDGKVEKIDLRESNKEMMYEVWNALLIALCTAFYRMDPSVINAKPWSGGQGPSLSEASRIGEIELAKEEGLQGDIQHLTDGILNEIAKRCHPDLRVFWEYGDHDPVEEAELYLKRTQVDWSRNDVRVMEGKHPRGFYLDDKEYEDSGDEEKAKHDENPWNWPTDSVFASAMNSKAQMEQQKEQFDAMQEQGGMGGGMFGEDQDGFGGQEDPDDGFGQPQEQQPFGPPGGGGPPGMGGPPGGPPGMGGPPMQKGRRMRKGRKRKGQRDTPITVVVYPEL